MKKILLTLLIFVSLLAQSQTFNNEWIDYNKTYYKFKIGNVGLYRITHRTLDSLGIGNVPAEQFQLWRRGEQLPIYTSIQTGLMGSADYIEFWSEFNDGKADKELYKNPDFQLNDHWSLMTDTIEHFLTINPNGNNFRLVPTANILPSSLAPDSYFVFKAGNYPFAGGINSGFAAVVGSSIYSSAFDQGEGWVGPNIPVGGTYTVPFTNLFPFTGSGAPDPVLIVNATGNALNPRNFEIKVNGTQVLNRTMDFFDYAKTSTPVSIGLISGGTATIEVKNLSAAPVDRMAVAKTELIYPRQFNFGGANNFIFELSSNAAGNYLEIAGFNFGDTNPVLYDLTNGKRYIGNIDIPSLVRVALEPSAVTRKLLLVTQVASFPKRITLISQRNFIDYSLPANQGDFIIITHPSLLTGSGASEPVEDYRVYRNSTAGGSHNAKIYLIDQLTDQFGWGVPQHPSAIRNFIRFIRTRYSNPIKNIFLVGKGVNYVQYRNNVNNPNINSLALVPTFGFPASDILLSAENGSDIPVTPIGRLSVINGDEVSSYLNKVKQYELDQQVSSPLISDLSWKKNVVHIVGASDQNLQTILDINMTNYKAIVQDTLYGANVHTFSKTSTDPVEQSNNTRLKNLFSEGIGVVTYFGHSSATTLEYNLDDPQSYNNQGKYPVFIFLGCNAGNFFNFNIARLQTNETISEKYVLAEERGGIASVASTSLGIVHYLDIYNTRTYDAFSKTKYGKSIGEIMKEAITQTFNLTTQSDFYARLQCEQTTLHGDPALKLHAFPKPDYVIEDPLLKISPSFISVAESSFKVDASFFNIGRATNKDVVIEVKRTYPDLTTEVIQRDIIPGIRFKDSISYNIPIVATRDKGLNKITVTIDADNEVDELFETNNSITKDVFIFEDEARPIYPSNYAIVNRQNIKLIASTANPFAALRQYNMEIDTTELFNSAVKVTRTVSSTGGVLEFTPGFTFQDSTVYYWRVSAAPVSGPITWNTSSFIYLANSDVGFSQFHYYQHLKSGTDNIALDAQSRIWKFDSTGHFIFAKNGVFTTATNQEGDLIVSPDGIPFIRSACIGFSLIFNIFNPLTFQPNRNLTGQYSTPLPCQDSRQWNYEYSYLTPASRKLAMDFMDSIPAGYIVVVRNIMNPGQPAGGYINSWIADESINGVGNTLYHKLKNVGFNVLDSFNQPRSFIHMYVKGNAGFVPSSVMSNGRFDLVSMTRDFMTPDTVGYITSPAFGKAKAWKEIQWRGTNAPDITPGDAPTVDVIGVEGSGNEAVLFSGLDINQQDFNIASIDAQTYPYLKLRMRNADSINYTAYQMKFWKITYDPVPEGAMAPNIFLKVKDTVDVGEPVDFKIAFKNLTNVDFDSVKVKMLITDKNNVPHIIPIPKKRPLPGNDPVNDTLHVGTLINTENFSGSNTVYLEVNPDDDQPEQYHFNNFAFRNLYVKPDSLNPLLDVTFDGVHILNRDIVSSKPDIVVKLKDEARWMILNDTSLLTLNVRYPNGSTRRFYFNNDTLQFTPAGQAPSVDNTAMVNFKPYFAEDGEYELILTGKDRSENAAGAIEYRIIFEVINKPMISNMLNYPNPFTTSTAFVFTITGSEVPQNIKIEIMTITGKIVREITKDELGPLQIGRNITEFKWDGTDQYGQKLANGIYLYRVVTNLNGKSLDKYKSQSDKTDKYFNKGYGKMYLMR